MQSWKARRHSVVVLTACASWAACGPGTPNLNPGDGGTADSGAAADVSLSVDVGSDGVSTQDGGAAADGSGDNSTSFDGATLDSSTTLDGGGGLTAELVRDEHHVPHIYANTMRAGIYALGYAAAQDRLFEMNFFRMSLRGRRAEFFAHAEVAPNLAEKQAHNAALVASDKLVRIAGYAQNAESKWSQLPGDIPQLLQAYADGVNAWINHSGFQLGSAFAAAGITSLEPWSPADCLLAWDHVGLFRGNPAGVQADLDVLTKCESPTGCGTHLCGFNPPADEDAAQVPPAATWPPTYPPGYAISAPRTIMSAPRTIEATPVMAPVKASHCWAVHGSKTTSGKPILGAEPKLPISRPAWPWYHFHLQVPSEDVDVRGAGFAGTPAVVVYLSRYTSQSITAGSGDSSDLFELTLGLQPESYKLDGQDLPFTIRNESIKVRNGTAIPVVVRSTVFGPVWNEMLDTSLVAPTRLFALRHGEFFRPNSHSIVAGIKFMRATSLAQYRDALRHWVFPAVNALYAGVDKGAPANDHGHIAYHAATAIPQREQLIKFGQDLTGQIPYDGSTTANDWMSILDINWNAHVIDPAAGFLYNANNGMVGNWYHNLFYSGLGGPGDGYRALELKYQLAKFTTQPSGATPTQIHQMHYDAGSITVEIFRKALQTLKNRSYIAGTPSINDLPQTDKEKAVRVLDALDLWFADGAQIRRSAKTFRLAGVINSTMTAQSRYDQNPAFTCKWNGGESGAAHFLRAFDADPLVLAVDEALYVLNVAATSWNKVLAAEPALSVNPNNWPAPVGPFVSKVLYQASVSYCQQPTIPGQTCSLDPAHELSLDLDRAHGHTVVDAAQMSFPLTADFSGPNAGHAILPPGISEDPQSAYSKDMQPILEQMSRGQDVMPQAALDRSQITAVTTTVLTYVP